MSGNGTARILQLARILLKHTDTAHGLTLPQIQQLLQDEGCSVERKALYRDFRTLCDAGLPIEKLATRPVSYCITPRLFSKAELSFLIDAIRRSKTLAKRDQIDLAKRVISLGSDAMALQLERQLPQSDEDSAAADSIQVIELLQQAIEGRRDISFTYRRYDANGSLVEVASEEGIRRTKTPLSLIYDEDTYYLLVYDEVLEDHLRCYRVDRMGSVMLLGDAAPDHRLSPDFDLETYERQTLGMYSATPVVIWLLVSEHLVGNIIDIFGADNAVSVKTDEVEGEAWAKIRVKSAPSPVLFGKLAQFAGNVRVLSPRSVADAYAEHLRRALQFQTG